MAPAKWLCSAAENFTMCASSTSGWRAGLAIESACGKFRPNFLTYSSDCPEQ